MLFWNAVAESAEEAVCWCEKYAWHMCYAETEKKKKRPAHALWYSAYPLGYLFYTGKCKGCFLSASQRFFSLHFIASREQIPRRLSLSLDIFFFQKKKQNETEKGGKIAQLFILYEQMYSPWHKVCFKFETIASKPLYLPTNSNGLM